MIRPHALSLLTLCAFLAACTAQDGASESPDNDVPAVTDSEITEIELDGICEDPRPEVCTMDYRPVCGYAESGHKTYSNACTACSDIAVVGYTDGECQSASAD